MAHLAVDSVSFHLIARFGWVCLSTGKSPGSSRHTTMKEIPPEAGFPGLPIDDSPPETAKAFAFLNEEIRPRREFHEEMVRGSSFTGLLIVANQLSPIHVEHIFVVVCKGPRGEWRKVEFGKLGGSLYPVCASTPWDLKEFGLGVAM